MTPEPVSRRPRWLPAFPAWIVAALVWAVLALAIALSACAAPERPNFNAHDWVRQQHIAACQGSADWDAFDACMAERGYSWPPAWYVAPTKEKVS